MLEKLACSMGRRDEVPNKELAKELAERNDKEGIKEIVDNLKSRDKDIQSDCIKVLYEVGYINPGLIKDYVQDFLSLLSSKNNRLVWGGMIALSTIADKAAAEIYGCLNTVIKATDKGSVITIDNGIKVLAKVASIREEYSNRILPYLLEHLCTCIPREVVPHAEYSLYAINSSNKEQFIEVLKKRETDLNVSQMTRLRKLYKKIG